MEIRISGIGKLKPPSTSNLNALKKVFEKGRPMIISTISCKIIDFNDFDFHLKITIQKSKKEIMVIKRNGVNNLSNEIQLIG
jgi:hypothetical protein